jgi:CRP/FNR family transcriptional regulator
VGSDGIFGELSLIGCADSSESSRTIDKVKLLAWSHTEVDQQLRRNPQLAWILIRYFVQRCAELNARLENIAFRKTSHRVILGLLQLADSLGKPSDFGYRLGPLTHQMIAEYVGTSREIVTANMTGLRRAGLLRYSRKQIEVSTAAMDRALREGGITPNPVETPLVRAASSSGTASLRA